MEILESRAGDATVVHVAGNVNSANAPALDQHLQALVNAGCRAIVVDMSALDHMTSAGFRCLLRAEKQVERVAGKLVLCGVQGLTLELFQVSGFVEMFRVAGSREEAARQAAA